MEASKQGHTEDCSCCASVPTNPSVQQSLDELEFERSIWQAAIDNDVHKINKFSNAQKFDPNATDKYGYTALHYAARNGCLDAAKTLIKCGADCNAQTGSLRATPLHRAVTAKKTEMVRLLVQSGANLKLKDSDGLTPFDRAMKEGHQQILDILRKNL
ncbi:Ankyrin repeat domain-containing protein 39 [Orchesella cincta]|uniref:Ankyrin repeat domain-containing protein 39 n=1 Tax=Orchesella cincta TaxID=48709 RepID=A0A1D2MK11_ORCCI|nr:Ankyrin repeat domain-containing protein 39 [Orchesella cincta]